MTIEDVWQMYDDVCQANAELQDQLESKESELKGALVIPEGWKLDALNIINFRYCAVKLTHNKHLQINGEGRNPNEALRNALEQIDNTKL